MIGFLHKEKIQYQWQVHWTNFKKFLKMIIIHISLYYSLIEVKSLKKYDLFENNYNEDEARGHIFYCDPQQPDQKPHVENNHNFVRNILPNKRNLDKLTQEDLDLMFSHINSVPRASLGESTPYEVFTYFMEIMY